MSKSEWVPLGEIGSYIGDGTRAAVDAAIRCRRIVEVRRSKNGKLAFFARVPLPGVVARALSQTMPAPEGLDERQG